MCNTKNTNTENFVILLQIADTLQLTQIEALLVNKLVPTSLIFPCFTWLSTYNALIIVFSCKHSLKDIDLYRTMCTYALNF